MSLVFGMIPDMGGGGVLGGYVRRNVGTMQLVFIFLLFIETVDPYSECHIETNAEISNTMKIEEQPAVICE